MAPIDRETFEALDDAIIVAQSRAIANQYVLYEVVRALARQKTDPKKFLGTMSEQVIGRMDQWPIEDQSRTEVEARGAVERFFANIARNL